LGFVTNRLDSPLYIVQLPNMSDEEKKLIKEAKKGSENAFGVLYTTFLSRIYRYILSYVYDSHIAEDLTQETFLKAWKYLPKYSTKKGTFQAFLYRIARNISIDHQRKRKHKVLNIEFGENVTTGEDFEEKLIADEKIKKVHEALSGLKELERQLVILRFFEELPFAEIAKIVGKREGAVRVKTFRAIKKLKDIYTKNE